MSAVSPLLLLDRVGCMSSNIKPTFIALKTAICLVCGQSHQFSLSLPPYFLTLLPSSSSSLSLSRLLFTFLSSSLPSPHHSSLYLLQTFENVLAQGGLEYRKRLVSTEAAIRLLSIAQSSTRNESIQASCGMALAHMVHLVVTTNPYIPTAIASTFASPIDSAPSPEPGSGSATPSSRRLAGSGPLARVNATKGGTIRMEMLSGRESPSKTLAGSLVGSPGGLGLTQIIVR
jgi:hypothetical protein